MLMFEQRHWRFPHLSCLSWSVQAAMVCDTDRKVMTAEVEQNCSVSR